jgi:hypothetical protein
LVEIAPSEQPYGNDGIFRHPLGTIAPRCCAWSATADSRTCRRITTNGANRYDSSREAPLCDGNLDLEPNGAERDGIYASEEEFMEHPGSRPRRQTASDDLVG